jgi:hypothetical protein
MYGYMSCRTWKYAKHQKKKRKTVTGFALLDRKQTLEK